MSRRRSFVPEGLCESFLEGRLAPSFFGSVGDWFSSEYKNVKQDLGITHKAKASTATQENSLLKVTSPNKTAAVSPFHGLQVVRTK